MKYIKLKDGKVSLITARKFQRAQKKRWIRKEVKRGGLHHRNGKMKR